MARSPAATRPQNLGSAPLNEELASGRQGQIRPEQCPRVYAPGWPSPLASRYATSAAAAAVKVMASPARSQPSLASPEAHSTRACAQEKGRGRSCALTETRASRPAANGRWPGRARWQRRGSSTAPLRRSGPRWRRPPQTRPDSRATRLAVPRWERWTTTAGGSSLSSARAKSREPASSRGAPPSAAATRPSRSRSRPTRTSGTPISCSRAATARPVRPVRPVAPSTQISSFTRSSIHTGWCAVRLPHPTGLSRVCARRGVIDYGALDRSATGPDRTSAGHAGTLWK